YLMAALGRDRRRLHPAGTAAGDENPAPRRRGLAIAIDQLAAAFGELDAGDRIAEVEMPDAGLVAADAGADVVEPAGLGLAGHGGVADHRPGHAAEVGLAGGEHLLRLLRLVDPPGDEDRLRDDRLH